MSKRKNLWDISSVNHKYVHLQTKEEKELLKQIDKLNYKIIELKCEIDCLLKKKLYFLNKVKELEIK